VPVTNKQISALVVQLITEKGITATELARRMGVPSLRLSDKRGAKGSWKFSELFSLANALDMDPIDLVTRLEADATPAVG